VATVVLAKAYSVEANLFRKYCLLDQFVNQVADRQAVRVQPDRHAHAAKRRGSGLVHPTERPCVMS
jgi:hypothetical protein